MTMLNIKSVMATETNFNIDTISFINCIQMLNYKLNFLSRIECKC